MTEIASNATSGQDLARNLSFFALSSVAVRILGLGVIVVVARKLSNEDFGRYSVALAIASLFTLVVELGMGAFLVREATQAPARVGVALGHVLSFQAGMGAVAVLGCALAGVLLGYDEQTLTAAVLLAVASVITIAQRSLLALLVALQRVKAHAAFHMAQAVLVGGVTLAAVLAGGGPAAIGAASLAASVATVPVAVVMLRRRWDGRIRFQRAGMADTLAVGVAYSAARLGQILLMYVDAVMVQALRGNAAAAQYGAAYRLLLALRMIPDVYSNAVSQPAAKLAQTDRAALSAMFNRTTSHLVLLSLPIAVGGCLLSEPIMTAVFGERYASAAPAAALLLITVVASFPIQMMMTVSLAMGLERRNAVAYFTTVVVNVICNAVLIPPYGVTGAAAAMVVSYVVLAVMITALLWTSGVRISLTSRYAKAVAAAAGMAVVVALTRSLPLPVVIALGAAVYAGLLKALHTLDAEDLVMLPGGSRLGWLVR